MPAAAAEEKNEHLSVVVRGWHFPERSGGRVRWGGRLENIAEWLRRRELMRAGIHAMGNKLQIAHAHQQLDHGRGDKRILERRFLNKLFIVVGFTFTFFWVKSKVFEDNFWSKVVSG